MRTLSLLAFLILSLAAFAQKQAWQPAPGHITLSLWPKQAPSEQGTPPDSVAPKALASKVPAQGTAAEIDTTSPKDNFIAGKPLVRLTNVSTPTMTLYAPPGQNSGAAVIVFPGGGYQLLAIDLEGTEVCDWLTSVGVNCILVKYRVPNSGPYPKSAAALQDAQRAVSLARAHAAEWHIDTHRTGVLGFSAGGHLAATISTHFNQRVYPPTDAADQLSCRPDFTLLIYPAHLASKESNFALDANIRVTGNTPPTFLVQAEDDAAAPVKNSILYYLALIKAKVPAEMHVYGEGGHGFGLRPTTLPATTWPQTAKRWLHTINILPAKALHGKTP